MTWKKLLEPDGTYAVDESERYLFAIELSNGSWFYFVDSLVWDSETPPQWSTDEHGYSGCESEMWFMPLPAPPEEEPLESAQVRMSKTLCGPIPSGRPEHARNEASGETTKDT